jgi:hypothetical protein
MWQPIETFVKPTKEYDYDQPRVLLYSPRTGIVIGMCLLVDEETKEYSFRYDCEWWSIEPTHWMPLPENP